MSPTNDITQIPDPWPSRLRAWLGVPVLTVAALLAAGFVAERAGGAVARGLQTAGNPDQMPPADAAVRRDPVGVLLGGFAPTAANVSWLMAFEASGEGNWSETGRLLLQACRMAPHSDYFWKQAAHQLAFNFPTELARREERRLKRKLTEAELAALRERGGRRAVQLLRDEALAWHPNDARILDFIGLIHLSVREDKEAALPFFKLASEQPGAPYHSARIYAETLRQLGRSREAYDWYRRLYPTLPKDLLQANADLVLERIRELETELNLPARECFLEAGTSREN